MTCKDCLHFFVCEKSPIPNPDKCNFLLRKSEYAEVKHGEWIEKAKYEHGGIKGIYLTCSLCGRIEYHKEPYCHCGARMDGKKVK